MNNALAISSYCRIHNQKVIVNGTPVFDVDGTLDSKNFLKSLYQLTGEDYPKYFKMDTLCKLAFAASSMLLLDGIFLSKYGKDKVGILLSNSTSSLDTDRKHEASITDADKYFPSPALFVYTLPSIMCGEIAIRYSITGENSFLLSDAFSPTLLLQQVQILFAGEYIEAAIVGWVDILNGQPDVMLMFVEKGKANDFTISVLEHLYHGS